MSHGVMFFSLSVLMPNLIARLILSSISEGGYYLSVSVVLRSCRRISRVFPSDTIVQILIKGAFLFMCFGWNELSRTCCFKSIGL